MYEILNNVSTNKRIVLILRKTFLLGYFRTTLVFRFTYLLFQYTFMHSCSCSCWLSSESERIRVKLRILMTFTFFISGSGHANILPTTCRHFQGLSGSWREYLYVGVCIYTTRCYQSVLHLIFIRQYTGSCRLTVLLFFFFFNAYGFAIKSNQKFIV